MESQMIIWAVAFVAAVLLEIASMQLVSIWFAVGALAAFAVSFFTQSFGIQLTVFVAVTGIMLAATRPLIKKIHKPAVPTNHELEVGQQAIVIEDIDASQEKGRVRLRGVDWSASTEDGSILKTGESAIVIKVTGARLLVRRKED